MEAGFDAGNLSRIETGKQNPSLDRLERIARAMSVSVADLFNMVEPARVAVGSNNVLRDGDGIIYNDEMQVVRRGFAALDARHRKMVLEFIKMLNRLQREDS